MGAVVKLKDMYDDFFRREGGWGVVTNRVSDRGGLTYSGITMSSFNLWRESNGERHLTSQEFLLTTREEHESFLYDEFIHPLSFVTDDRLCRLMVDWAMNAGLDDPTRALQLSLSNRNLYRCHIDGIIGPFTRAAWLLAKADEQVVRDIEREVLKLRMLFHIDRAFDRHVRDFLSSNDVTQLHNLRGWLNRAMEFL